MKKIIVIGCPGSGKSTFSRSLYKLTGLPLYHLDLMYWNDDKTIVDKNVFLDRLNDVLNLDEWIIDGNYISTMESRIQKCDTIVFLDYHVDICLDGIKTRVGNKRSDMPWIENEIDQKFIKYIERYNLDVRPNVLALLNKYSDKNIYIFKNRNESNEFLNVFNR